MGARRASGLVGFAWSCSVACLALGCAESEAPNPSDLTTDTGGSSATGGSGATGGSNSTGGSNATGGSGPPGGSNSTGGATPGGAGSGAQGGAGTGGTAGVELACPELPIPEEPGIVVTANGELIEFRQQISCYGGRPPTLDLSAMTDDTHWLSFRVFISPDGHPTIVPGAHRSGPGNTPYFQTHTESGVLNTIESNPIVVCMTEVGTANGERVSGTFAGTLVSGDGTQSTPASGAFSCTLVGVP